MTRWIALMLLLGNASCARADSWRDEAGKAAKLTHVPRPTTRARARSGESGKAAVEFSAALDEIARRTPHIGDESASIENKLAKIAVYRAEYPPLFEEVDQRYVRARASPSIDKSSPDVLDEHATEPYRLVWEYYLLTPAPDGSYPSYWYRATEAIARIRNPRSCLTLTYVIKAALSDPTQTTIEGCVPCQASLRALTLMAIPEAAEALAAAFPRHATAPGGANVRDEVMTSVAARIKGFGPERRAAWDAIVASAGRSKDPRVREWAGNLKDHLGAR